MKKQRNEAAKDDAPSTRDAETLFQESMPALLRAAARAREIARQTNTRLVIVRDGRIEHVHPDDLPPLPR